MSVKPCLQVVGSKVTMASAITNLLGPHTAYFEPYAGSAAVLLSKPAVPVEAINDIDDMLIDFYKTLKEPETRYRLIDALTYTPYARTEKENANDDPNLDKVERARRFMIRTCQGYIGSNDGTWTMTVHGRSGHSNATKWNNFRTRLSAVSERLQNVQIDNRNALEFMGRLLNTSDPELAVYLDPPYLAETRNGSRYLHETDADHHREMLELANRFEGPVVISGYPSPLYTQFLRPKGWVAKELSRMASSSRGRGRVSERTEVLWSNGTCQLSGRGFPLGAPDLENVSAS